MSIAEKIMQAKADYDDVYNAGYAAGTKAGGGKFSEGLEFIYVKTQDASFIHCGLSSLGTCIDTSVYVPCAAKDGMPVVSIGGRDAEFDGDSWVAFTCGNTEKLYLPDTVTSIGKWGMVLAANLKYIKFGRYFAEVGEEQYPDGGILSDVVFDFSSYVRSAPPTLADTSFLNGVVEVRVPAAMVDTWKAATNWSTVADKIVGV